MLWDWSTCHQIEIKETQGKILLDIGKTIQLLHDTENAIQCCFSWMFIEQKSRSWKNIVRMPENEQKKGIGRLCQLLLSRGEIHPQIEESLNALLRKRNLFVHGMFNDSAFGLDLSASVENAHAFLADFQQDLWVIRLIFDRYNSLFSEVPGTHDRTVSASGVVRKRFSQLVRRFKKHTEPGLS